MSLGSGLLILLPNLDYKGVSDVKLRCIYEPRRLTSLVGLAADQSET